ncbi:hypothetical protein GALMADRAFT_205922 [Galerina marginata CBS 339.88]|uniref:Uncharacterized protein n=1 Tax=Galerina marginata (strain CBS 339.88) TaxID=685588 RepID=A0A067TLV1_GALM3|nr:hypothetical protein GALMADRAFT_205922 [Galerina marginata CBS 339.88]
MACVGFAVGWAGMGHRGIEHEEGMCRETYNVRRRFTFHSPCNSLTWPRLTHLPTPAYTAAASFPRVKPAHDLDVSTVLWQNQAAPVPPLIRWLLAAASPRFRRAKTAGRWTLHVQASAIQCLGNERRKHRHKGDSPLGGNWGNRNPERWGDEEPRQGAVDCGKAVLHGGVGSRHQVTEEARGERRYENNLLVAFDAPSQALGDPGPSMEREVVMVREMGQQPSTGRTYRSRPSAVVDDPWLPIEDVEIGLDQDSAEADQAFNADFIDAEEAAAAVKEEAKKKKKKSLASVSSSSMHRLVAGPREMDGTRRHQASTRTFARQYPYT